MLSWSLNVDLVQQTGVYFVLSVVFGLSPPSQDKLPGLSWKRPMITADEGLV